MWNENVSLCLSAGPAVDSQAGDAGYGEFDRQHVTLFAVGVVAGCMQDRAYCAIWKRGGIEPRGIHSGAVVKRQMTFLLTITIFP
jgi:hypothetical protein